MFRDGKPLKADGVDARVRRNGIRNDGRLGSGWVCFQIRKGRAIKTHEYPNNDAEVNEFAANLSSSSGW